MYYFNYDEDNHPVDFDVFFGYSSSGDPAVMIKTGEKHDYTGEDTRDVRYPEFLHQDLLSNVQKAMSMLQTTFIMLRQTSFPAIYPMRFPMLMRRI